MSAKHNTRDEKRNLVAGAHGAMFEQLLYILKTPNPEVSAARLCPRHRLVDCRRSSCTRSTGTLQRFAPGTASCRATTASSVTASSIVRQLLFSAQAAPPGAQPGLISETPRK
jgi:hypothetical protein